MLVTRNKFGLIRDLESKFLKVTNSNGRNAVGKTGHYLNLESLVHTRFLTGKLNKVINQLIR